MVHIRGGNTLFGETRIQGSKNAVLPVMAAALLIQDTCVLENCPRISDVCHMQKLLTRMGCKISRAGRNLVIDAKAVSEDKMAGESVTGMRSSIMLLGAMLGRFGQATMEYPGGCVIGKRPIDMHLWALSQMGVKITKEENLFHATGKDLQGAVIRLPFASVGATENVILTAVAAKGVTVLQNAAREPEIITLCNFLKKAGAVIEGTGGSTLLILGGIPLHGIRFRIPADRIVAGTYLLSVLGCGGHIFLEDAPVAQLRSVMKLAAFMGAEMTEVKEGLSIMAKPSRMPIPYIKTEIFPGFPTDLQSPLMAVLSMAEGISVIEETIFEDRFGMAQELERMGANVKIEGKRATVTGISRLRGNEVSARDLRGGAGLVLAGCMAEGETIVKNRHFIERGYEDICRDYQNLGVNIYTG